MKWHCRKYTGNGEEQFVITCSEEEPAYKRDPLVTAQFCDAETRAVERALNRELPAGKLRRHDIPVAHRVGLMASEA